MLFFDIFIMTFTHWRYCYRKGYEILAIETDKDHIHFLIGYDCTDCVANIVKIVKQKTTYLLWQKYSRYLSKCYWKKKIFWSDGYFACSIGEVSTATIQRYIETQGWERKTALIPPLKSSGFPSPDYFMNIVLSISYLYWI